MKFWGKLRNKWLLIALILLGLTPILWFLGKDSDVLINGIDTNFPLDPLVWLKRRFYVWDSVINLGRDYSSSTTGVFFHFIQVIPFILNFSLQNTELFSLVFWFMAVVFSSFCFAKTFISKSKISQLIFVVLYSFNIYLFNTWENVKVANLALVVSLPIFLTILKSFFDGKIKFKKLLLFSFFGSVLSFGTGINPSYFIALFIGIAIYSIIQAIYERESVRRTLKGFAGVTVVLAVTNLFWILPLINFLFFSNKPVSVEDLGFTNWINSLSKNTSLVNVFRLQGAWDWYVTDGVGFPLYIPYALNYFFRAPFILFSFLIPALSIVSLVLRGNKNKVIYALFSVLLLLGVFLGTGSHTPTGTLFMFLSEKIPFFNFFRSPWYIFTPYVTIAFAGLVSLLFSRLEELSGKKKSVFRVSYKKVVFSLAFVFIVGNFLYSYPLITGKIFRPGREDGFFIKFPDYIWDAKDWLEERDSDNRLITYPDDDIESFSWRYRGTESILGLYSDQEYISPSFNVESESFENLLSRFYFYLKGGKYNSAISLLSYFGADSILVKNDAKTNASKIDNKKLEKLGKVTHFGEWSIYEFEGLGEEKVFTPQNIYINETSDNSKVLSGVADVLKKKSIIVSSEDTEVNKVSSKWDNSLVLREFDNNRLLDNPTSRIQEFEISNVRSGNYNIVLEKKGFEAKDILINSTSISFKNVKVSENEDKVIFGPVYIRSGDHKIIATYPESSNLVNIKDYSTLYDVPDISKEDNQPDTKTTIIVKSGKEDFEMNIPIEGFNPFINYQLSFDRKYFYGYSPVVDAVQFSPTGLLRMITLESGYSFDWEKKNIEVFPAEIESDLKIMIRVPGRKDGNKNSSLLENIDISRIYDNRAFLVESKDEPLFTNSPKIAFTKVSPVEYEVTATNVTEDYVLVFLENYNFGWELSSKDIDGEITHFSINGYANGWHIPAETETQIMKIYYKPQKLYVFGLFVLFGFLGLILFCSNKKCKKNT